MKLHVNCRPLWFSAVLFGTLLVWLLIINAFAALAEDHDAGGGTIPPLQNFTKTVRSVAGIQNEARPGEKVIYTISMHNTISESYTARIGVTDTIPAGLSVLTATIAPKDNAQFFTIDGVSFITWTVDVEYGASYTLTYSAEVTSTIGTLTNTAVLYEISNQYAAPTEITKTAQAVLKVHQWEVYLPLIRRDDPPPPKSQLPQFDHYNFEISTKLKSGWEQLVDDKSGNLIYSAQQTNLVMLDGSHVAWLGGAPGENKLSQPIALPADYSNLKVRYLYWIYSDEDSCSNDSADVRINGASIKNYLLCKAERTFDSTKGHGWVREVLDVAAYKGQAITLSFVTNLNESKNSNFFIDVVQLCSSDADAPPGTVRCDDPPTP
ncbi:MAG: DUF11 domain-containing protein [Caldilineaceae bacterium]|nr:DUF11 domain-containing protein [Caldilineaceae bacterium]